MFSNLYKYRKLILVFVKRDISAKYAGSILGLYWSIINPSIMFFLYFLVFGYFLKARISNNSNLWDFALYFSSGFFPWITFVSSVTRASTSIIDNKNFIKKIAFPNEIFPFFTVLSESLSLIITIVFFLIVFTFVKGMPSIFLIFLPIAIILQLIFALSLSLILSSITVFFRDAPHIFNAFFQVWFWATPVIYPVEAIPHSIKWIQLCNPAFYMMGIYRSSLFDGKIPQLSQIIIFCIFLMILLILSINIFKKTNKYFNEFI